MSLGVLQGPPGSTKIALGQVMAGDGQLDQALVNLPLRPQKLAPQNFPIFVGIKKATLVEVLNPCKKMGIVQF